MSNNNTQLPAEPKWKLILHEQVEDPYFEITNGPISLCAPAGQVGETEDEEDEIFKKVNDALNKSGIDFHSENKLELKQHIEVIKLEEELRQARLSVKSLRYSLDQRDQQQERGNKLALALRRLRSSVMAHPDYDGLPHSEWGGYVAGADEALMDWMEGKEVKPS